MTTAKKFLALIFILILNFSLYSQVKIKELQREPLTKLDSLYLQISDMRPVISLDDGWDAYIDEESEQKAKLNIPATFSGVEKLIFEKKFELNKEALALNKKELIFLGVNYSCEIFFNDVSIHKHPGGTLPFSVELNDELLNDGRNVLKVYVNAEYDAKNTIPLEQRYMFPDAQGGIIGDVLLGITPDIYLSNITVSSGVKETKAGETKLNFRVLSYNPENEKPEGLRVAISLYDRGGNSVANLNVDPTFLRSGLFEVNTSINLPNPVLWSPANPHYYSYKITLSQNDSIVDVYRGRTGYYSLQKKEEFLALNERAFSFFGTGYVPFDMTNKNLLGKARLTEELKQLKMTGFNAVRFSKVLPTPYIVEYCTELGLFVLVDLPLNSMPEHFASDKNFNDRGVSRIRSIVEVFNNSVSVAAFGMGSAYIANSPMHAQFISNLTSALDGMTDKLIYASFSGIQQSLPDGVDFAGIESYAEPYEKLTGELEITFNNSSKSSYFFSDILYPTFNGGTDGYLNLYSKEAQAKYFGDLIDYVKKNDIPGIFFSSYYDFQGKYSSLFSGYSKNNIYNIGILGVDKGQNTLSYKVIKSKLNNGEKVKIPLGSKSDDGPILFILTGLFLSIVLALLVNSKRKFREDVTRALFRPYNFFADVRDHRIISGFHSNILFLVLAGAHSLLLTNLLFYLRHNILLDKLLLSFASEPILATVSYLAWNPLEALMWLFFGSVVFIPLVSLFFLGTTFFIRTKVMYSSIYYSTIWAFLPLSLMLPLELVLYRVMVAGIANIYIYGVLVIFILWLIQRLLKGIYVIFDVRASSVYFTTFLLVLLIFGGTYLYFHLTEETTFYLINAWKQYSMM